MANSCPQQIKKTHLARKAVVYIRQSSEKQVLQNEGSTTFQRGQARFPTLWGWLVAAIEVIDEDLGLSGSTTVARSGYRRMVAEVEAGLIGAIFIADFTRAGRNARDWLELIEACKLHDVLVVVDGRIYDLRDSRERFLSNLIATFGEHENEMRRETLQRARIAKARAGKAVSPPPCGYVRLPDGSWAMDQDPAVQAAIHAMFREFRTCRSLRRTVDALLALGVKLPRRDRRVGIRWVAPQIETLAVILKHPAYKGDYVYRRHVSDPLRGRDYRGRVPVRLAAPEEQIVVADHHPAYVSREEWANVQASLAARAPSKARRNLGPGSALLQGIVRCGQHRNWAMATVYKARRRDGTQTHAYQCLGDYARGGAQCGRVSGVVLDRAIVAAVFARLRPPVLAAVRHALDQARVEDRGEQHRRSITLLRARERETDLHYRYMNVDPANRHVAADLERELEAAKLEVHRLQQVAAAPSSMGDVLDDDAFDELCALCGNLTLLWGAATTRNEDRKELLRTMVREIRIEVRTRETVRVRVVWADEALETTADVLLAPHWHRRVLELGRAGSTLAEIARHLTEVGAVTTRGRPWSTHAVREVLNRAGKRARGEQTHAA